MCITCLASIASRPRTRFTCRPKGLVLCLLLLALLASTPGCRSNELEIRPVKGVVTLDGKPLAGATVTFAPIDKGLPATGVTDDRGEFQLTTRKTNDGAMVGEHRISLALYRWQLPQPKPATSAPATPKAPDAAPPASPEEGPDTASAASGPGGNEPETLKSLIPERYTHPDTSELKFSVGSGDNFVRLELKSP